MDWKTDIRQNQCQVYVLQVSVIRSLLTYFTVLPSPTLCTTAAMATKLIVTHSSMLTRIFVALIYIYKKRKLISARKTKNTNYSFCCCCGKQLYDLPSKVQNASSETSVW